MAGHEHPHDEDADDDRRLRDHEQRQRSELAPQAAEARSSCDQHVTGEHGEHAERCEQHERRGTGVPAQRQPGRGGGDERGDQRDREAAAHGRTANRYPTPHTVSISPGASGSVSSLARSRRTWTVTVEVSV